MSFDDILKHTGELGLYQTRMYIVLCLLAVYDGSLAPLYLYITATLPHTCIVPTYNTTAYRNVTVEECYYSVNGSREECREWDYERNSTFSSTVVSQFNLVCEKNVWKANIRVMKMISAVVGASVIGYVADWQGRKKMLLISVFMLTTASFLIAFATNVITVCILVFMSCFGGNGTFTSSFNLGMEFVGVSKRFHTGIIIEYCYYVGVAWGAGIAYLIRDWDNLVIALAAPGVIWISLWWLIPESPRWLMSKGREAEAKVIVERMAKVNKVSLYEGYLDDIALVVVKTNSLRIWHLFQYRILILRNFIIGFNWIAVTLVFYVLYITIGDFSSSMQLNMFLSAICGLLGCVLSHATVNRVGRKALFIGCMFGSGVFCLSTILPRIFITESNSWVTITLALLGYLCGAAGFNVIFVHTVEMMPTSLRASGLCMASLVGRIGSIASPYMADIGDYIDGYGGEALPHIIIGGIAIVSSLLSCLLPETMNKPLPETIEDLIGLNKVSKTTKQRMKRVEAIEETSI